MSSNSDSAGSVYSNLLEKRIDEEERRGTSLQTRGLAVVTTSGVLVTLLFSVGSVTLKSQQYAAPRDARLLLIVGATAFVLAAAFGLASNLPRSYVRPALGDVQITDDWMGNRAHAEQVIAYSYVAKLASAQKGTDTIALLVKIAMAFEVLAAIVVVLAIAVVIS